MNDISEKTPTRQKPNFFNSLLCFCKWGPDKNGDVVPADASDSRRTAIKTRISRMQQDDDTKSQYESTFETSTQYTSGGESMFSDNNLPNIHGEVSSVEDVEVLLLERRGSRRNRHPVVVLNQLVVTRPSNRI